MHLNKFCYFLMAIAAIASILTPHPLMVWLLLINMLTVFIYGGDKFAARKGWRRVPEVTLLIFGLAGGWPGAIFGQHVFRHKTQKQPFRRWFFVTVWANLAIAASAFWFYMH